MSVCVCVGGGGGGGANVCLWEVNSGSESFNSRDAIHLIPSSIQHSPRPHDTPYLTHSTTSIILETIIGSMQFTGKQLAIPKS